jgi:hypothetical protein
MPVELRLQSARATLQSELLQTTTSAERRIRISTGRISYDPKLFDQQLAIRHTGENHGYGCDDDKHREKFHPQPLVLGD